MKILNIRPQTTNGGVADPANANSVVPQAAFARKLKMPGRSTAAPMIVPMTLLALSAAVSASFAHAEVEEGQFEISPFVGYHLFESDQNLENGATYGVRFGYSFTPHWAIEAAVSMVGSNVDDATIVGASEGQFRSPTDDVDLMLYQVDALYHFRPDNKFSPYVVGGFGAADYSPSISDGEMAAFNLGVGAKYWLADNLALRFDVRNHLVGEVFDHSYNNISATVGVSFAFGGKTEATPYKAAAREPEPVRTEQTAVPEPVEREVVADVIVLEFEDIHFDFDESTLTSEARKILQRSIATLKSNPESKVRIAGYTSAAGEAEHNQALSEQRATAIKNYLVKDGGISEQRLSVIGYGDTRPASHESSPENLNSVAAKENMRALFEIVVE